MILRLVSQSLLFRAAAAVSVASLVMLATPSIPLQFVGLMTLLMTAMFMGQRATLFEAVIPVDARRVFLTRIGVGLALMCLPLIAWILSGNLRGVPADPAAAFPGAGQNVQLLALPIAALAVILPHARRPGVLPLPGHTSFPALAWWAALAFGSAAAIGLLPVGIATAVLAGAALGTLGFTWHGMPKSYQVAPVGVEGAARPVLATGGAATGSPAVRWWRPVLRTVLPGHSLFTVMLFGLLGFSDTWLLYVLILLVPDMMGMARLRLRWLHTLPLPATALLWASLTPATLALVGVLLARAVIGPAVLPEINALDEGVPHAYSRVHDFDRRTRVPLAYWRIAPRGEGQVVRAPWGETTTTDTVSLPGLTLYNPYSARTGSSPELVEWQFGRATAAVHGRAFTTAEYHADGFVPPRRVTRNASVYLLGGSMAVTFVLLIAWLVELGHWHALTTRRLLQYGVSALTWAILMSMAVLELYGMFRHGTPLLVPLGAALAMRAAAALPNLGIVAVVAALPAVAAYSLLHWQTGKSDVTGAIRTG